MPSFADDFQCIMRGGLVRLDLNGLLFFVMRINELGINTLKIQQTQDGEYLCKVDENTARAFQDRYPSAPQYKREDVQSKE